MEILELCAQLEDDESVPNTRAAGDLLKHYEKLLSKLKITVPKPLKKKHVAAIYDQLSKFLEIPKDSIAAPTPAAQIQKQQQHAMPPPTPKDNS